MFYRFFCSCAAVHFLNDFSNQACFFVCLSLTKTTNLSTQLCVDDWSRDLPSPASALQLGKALHSTNEVHFDCAPRHETWTVPPKHRGHATKTNIEVLGDSNLPLLYSGPSPSKSVMSHERESTPGEALPKRERHKNVSRLPGVAHNIGSLVGNLLKATNMLLYKHIQTTTTKMKIAKWRNESRFKAQTSLKAFLSYILLSRTACQRGQGVRHGSP